MPMVRRKIQIENDQTTMQKSNNEHELYVRPRDKKPGDVVIPPTDRQLAELVLQYPEEFGEEAKKRGITPGITTSTDGKAAELHQLDEKDLIKAIGDLDAEADGVTLWAVFELEVDEERGGKNRTKVLAALAKQGIKE